MHRAVRDSAGLPETPAAAAAPGPAWRHRRAGRRRRPATAGRTVRPVPLRCSWEVRTSANGTAPRPSLPLRLLPSRRSGLGPWRGLTHPDGRIARRARVRSYTMGVDWRSPASWLLHSFLAKAASVGRSLLGPITFGAQDPSKLGATPHDLRTRRQR